MSWSYIIPLVVDGIGLSIALYFLFSDYIKYPRMAGNGALSIFSLVFCGWMGTSYYLYYHGNPYIASIMAWIPAVPLLGYGLLLLMFLILNPDMK